jgi:hypothetical protein
MADEEGIYGGDDHDRFEAEEFDQDYVDGGVREDVSFALCTLCLCACYFTIWSLYSAGPAGWPGQS